MSDPALAAAQIQFMPQMAAARVNPQMPQMFNMMAP
jgi:hypothetical protein